MAKSNLYSAKYLPIETGPAAWKEILPPAPSYPALTVASKADFVIIGAGFAGLAAARRLTQIAHQAQIVILEANEIAEGATGRNSGFMIDIPHDLSSHDYAGQGVEDDQQRITLNRHAIDFARKAVVEYGIHEAYFDPAGKVNGAVTEIGDVHNRSFAKHLKAIGEKSERLDRQAMRELTGSDYYCSGLYTGGTVMLQPAGYVQAFAQGLSQAQVRIYENSPALQLQRIGGDWVIKTPQGQVSTPKIILANNGHLESFGFAQRRLMHIFLYASMTPDLDMDHLQKIGGAPRWNITPSDPLGTTMRKIDPMQGGNRIITRSCATFCPSMKASVATFKRAEKEHQLRFDARFPQLAGLKMQFRWAGHLCFSRNDLSIMREIDDNIFTACCQNGLGTARGTLTGIAAAELANGHRSNITDFFTLQPLPKKLPHPLISSLGANLYLRFQEWRARKE